MLRQAFEALESCPLVIEGETLALDPAAVEIDTTTFEGLASEASSGALESAMAL